MPFLLIPGNSAASIKAREPDFADIRAYLLSLSPRAILSRSIIRLPKQGKDRSSSAPARDATARTDREDAIPTSWFRWT